MINNLITRLAALVRGGMRGGHMPSRIRWMEGGLYVISQEDGTRSAIKILKIDEHGVHIRLYSNSFQGIPAAIDEHQLYIAGVDRGPDEHFGMGHMPISNSSFATMGAVFIQQSSVDQEELVGYDIWLEAEGGYY